MTMNLTLSKYRSFQQTASLRGTFTFLALDHRQNLRRANPRFQDQAELSRFKLDVTRELAPYATAVLLDPEVSAVQAIAAGDPTMVYRAICHDPLTAAVLSLAEIREMTNELFAVHKGHLPQFKVHKV